MNIFLIKNSNNLLPITYAFMTKYENIELFDQLLEIYGKLYLYNTIIDENMNHTIIFWLVTSVFVCDLYSNRFMIEKILRKYFSFIHSDDYDLISLLFNHCNVENEKILYIVATSPLYDNNYDNRFFIIQYLMEKHQSLNIFKDEDINRVLDYFLIIKGDYAEKNVDVILKYRYYQSEIREVRYQDDNKNMNMNHLKIADPNFNISNNRISDELPLSSDVITNDMSVVNDSNNNTSSLLSAASVVLSSLSSNVTTVDNTSCVMDNVPDAISSSTLKKVSRRFPPKQSSEKVLLMVNHDNGDDIHFNRNNVENSNNVNNHIRSYKYRCYYYANGLDCLYGDKCYNSHRDSDKHLQIFNGLANGRYNSPCGEAFFTGNTSGIKHNKSHSVVAGGGDDYYDDYNNNRKSSVSSSTHHQQASKTQASNNSNSNNASSGTSTQASNDNSNSNASSGTQPSDTQASNTQVSNDNSNSNASDHMDDSDDNGQEEEDDDLLLPIDDDHAGNNINDEVLNCGDLNYEYEIENYFSTDLIIDYKNYAEQIKSRDDYNKLIIIDPILELGYLIVKCCISGHLKYATNKDVLVSEFLHLIKKCRTLIKLGGVYINDYEMKGAKLKEFKDHLYHILSKFSLFNIWKKDQLEYIAGETIDGYFKRLNVDAGIIIYIIFILYLYLYLYLYIIYVYRKRLSKRNN